ncbi:unnamed protein product, partial [Lymnaea stagnalis]
SVQTQVVLNVRTHSVQTQVVLNVKTHSDQTQVVLNVRTHHVLLTASPLWAFLWELVDNSTTPFDGTISYCVSFLPSIVPGWPCRTYISFFFLFYNLLILSVLHSTCVLYLAGLYVILYGWSVSCFM